MPSPAIDGNGKGHHDPPLCLKKLLCFGENGWKGLRGLVGRKDRGRAAVRVKPQCTDPLIEETFEDAEERSLDLPSSDLRLGIAVLDWWEVPRWHEVWDEWSLWGDPHPETMRIARNLQRGKRMDT